MGVNRGSFDAGRFNEANPATWPAGAPETITVNGEPLTLDGEPVTVGGRYADGDYWTVTTPGVFRGERVKPGGRIIVRL